MMNRGVHKVSVTKAVLIVVVGAIVVTGPIAAGAVRTSKVAAVIREVVSPMTAPPAPVGRSGQVQAPRTTPPAPVNDKQLRGAAQRENPSPARQLEFEVATIHEHLILAVRARQRALVSLSPGIHIAAIVGTESLDEAIMTDPHRA